MFKYFRIECLIWIFLIFAIIETDLTVPVVIQKVRELLYCFQKYTCPTLRHLHTISLLNSKLSEDTREESFFEPDRWWERNNVTACVRLRHFARAQRYTFPSSKPRYVLRSIHDCAYCVWYFAKICWKNFVKSIVIFLFKVFGKCSADRQDFAYFVILVVCRPCKKWGQGHLSKATSLNCQFSQYYSGVPAVTCSVCVRQCRETVLSREFIEVSSFFLITYIFFNYSVWIKLL